MSRQEVLKNIPADQLDRVVQNFRDDGATEVDSDDNGDGTFDVTATFPDDG